MYIKRIGDRVRVNAMTSLEYEKYLFAKRKAVKKQQEKTHLPEDLFII
jgi:hypothetical protein